MMRTSLPQIVLAHRIEELEPQDVAERSAQLQQLDERGSYQVGSSASPTTFRSRAPAGNIAWAGTGSVSNPGETAASP